jgi:hypothetical protein
MLHEDLVGTNPSETFVYQNGVKLLVSDTKKALTS